MDFSSLSKFPCEAWRLTASFKPVPVTLTGRCWYKEWFETTEGRKTVHQDSAYETKEDAIRAGYAKISEAEEKIERMKQTLEKKRKQLEKASK